MCVCVFDVCVFVFVFVCVCVCVCVCGVCACVCVCSPSPTYIPVWIIVKQISGERWLERRQPAHNQPCDEHTM